MDKRILIILGAPNTSDGVLSKIAKSRLDHCLKIYSETDLILCTGGWGEHFNTTPKPHSFYAKEYLLKNGIAPNCFLDSALSGNTVEDAVKVKKIVSKVEGSYLLIIVTSDFHIERSELIFKKILKGFNMVFTGAKTVLPQEELEIILEHEKKSIKKISENGLYY